MNWLILGYGTMFVANFLMLWLQVAFVKNGLLTWKRISPRYSLTLSNPRYLLLV